MTIRCPERGYIRGMHGLGNAWIRVNVSRPGPKTPFALGFWTHCLTMFLADIGTHYAQAKVNGAEIVEEAQRTV